MAFHDARSRRLTDQRAQALAGRLLETSLERGHDRAHLRACVKGSWDTLPSPQHELGKPQRVLGHAQVQQSSGTGIYLELRNSGKRETSTLLFLSS